MKKALLLKPDLVNLTLDKIKKVTRRPKRIADPGDVLYVRETWHDYGHFPQPKCWVSQLNGKPPVYEADILRLLSNGVHGVFPYGGGISGTETMGITANEDKKARSNGTEPHWRRRPSLHLPKTNSRLFLLVKKVWAEKISDMTEADAKE